MILKFKKCDMVYFFGLYFSKKSINSLKILKVMLNFLLFSIVIYYIFMCFKINILYKMLNFHFLCSFTMKLLSTFFFFNLSKNKIERYFILYKIKKKNLPYCLK